MRTIDLFCGAGGGSWGARLAGAEIVAACDLSPIAARVYRKNFPDVRFYEDRLENIRPQVVAAEAGPIDLLLASPECTNHSPAKGAAPRCEKSRETAFQVTRFAEILAPRWIVVENVVSMRRWKRYAEFVQGLEALGYDVHEHVLNAADFGVPQARRRLFLLCDRQGRLPNRIAKGSPGKAACTLVDTDATYTYTPLLSPRRAPATVARAERAIRELGAQEAFILVYYGSDQAGGWQALSRPLRTVTTLDRFALVRPSESGHRMRMLQPAELQTAMGMPKCFKIDEGTRRDRIRLIGNAVCPPVMRTVVRHLVKS